MVAEAAVLDLFETYVMSLGLEWPLSEAEAFALCRIAYAQAYEDALREEHVA